MKAVWKYPAGFDAFTLNLPVGAQVVHFEMQQRAPTMWMLVDTDAEVEPRDFRVVGTGHPIPNFMEHLGTCIDHDLNLVWHLFA